MFSVMNWCSTELASTYLMQNCERNWSSQNMVMQQQHFVSQGGQGEQGASLCLQELWPSGYSTLRIHLSLIHYLLKYWKLPFKIYRRSTASICNLRGPCKAGSTLSKTLLFALWGRRGDSNCGYRNCEFMQVPCGFSQELFIYFLSLHNFLVILQNNTSETFVYAVIIVLFCYWNSFFCIN